jgi:hypothetical protein
MFNAKYEPSLPQIQRAQVVAVRPEAADRKRLAMHMAADSDPGQTGMRVVKLYLDPSALSGGRGAALYLGDHWIRKYWEFPGGIYFNVYDPEFLRKRANDTFRFTLDHETFRDSGVRLESPAAQLALGQGAAQLPTKTEALQK